MSVNVYGYVFYLCLYKAVYMYLSVRMVMYFISICIRLCICVCESVLLCILFDSIWSVCKTEYLFQYAMVRDTTISSSLACVNLMMLCIFIIQLILIPR